MFNVIVSFGHGQQWQLMFEDHENAKSVLKAHRDGADFSGRDSFGTEFHIRANCINGVLIEDLSKSGDAAVERALYQQRANAKVQSKIQADPLLRLAAGNAGMPMAGPMLRS